MEIIVREAVPDDSGSIAGLSGQLGYQATGENMRKRLSGLLNNSNDCVFVAAADGHIIGWIHGFYSLTVESDPLVEIAGLVIDKDQHRKGIGKMLVNKVIAWTQTKEVSKIRVRSRTMRKEAHLFYQGIGFTEVKEQKVFDKPLI